MLSDKVKDTDNIIDIDLDTSKRSKFRINGDPDSIIELNISDFGILDRLRTGLERLQDEMTSIANYDGDDTGLSAFMKEADKRMRECVDYIFDFPVSAACVKYGTMYDLKDGKFVYEIVIDKLTQLYADNISSETKKIEARMQKHTASYTKKKKR